MRKIALAVFCLLATLATAVAQQLPSTVPDHSVVGRVGSGSGSGPVQAIPFAYLSTLLNPGVTSLNSLSGDLSIVAGTGITVTPGSSTITIAGTSGVTTLNSLSGNLSIVAGAGITVTPSGSNVTVAGLRATNPGNFYVSATGSDAHTCLNSTTQACLTGQHVVDLILTEYDLQGSNAVINFGAGTFCNMQITGPLPGAASPSSGSGSSAAIVILGAGSGSTTIEPCNGDNVVVYCLDYCKVGLGSVTLTGNAVATSYDFFIQNFSYGYIANTDVVFAASTAASIVVEDYSQFRSDRNWKISGCGQNVFLLSSYGEARVLGGATVTITGTPTCSISFLDAIDHSFYNSLVTYSGTLHGTRYILALQSNIDNENDNTRPPGDAPGQLSNAVIYQLTGVAYTCIGANTSCPIVTAPTGGGTGATYAVNAGSADLQGWVTFHSGSSGVSTSGSFHISTPSLNEGLNGLGGSCMASLNDGGTAWPAGSTVRAYYQDGANSGDILITWNSNGLALTTSANYDINYQCG